MMKRAVGIGIVILSMLYLPFWVTAVISVAAMVYFRWFFEAVIIFFCIDALFGAPSARFFHTYTAVTLLGLLTLCVVEYVKTRVRLYHA